MSNIAIVYYSMYGHVAQMADAVAAGVTAAGGKPTLYQVAETLPVDVLAKMGASAKKPHAIATPETLQQADGVIFGFPTRFGMCCAQMKAFMDSTGGLWQSGALVGKPAGIFISTGTQNGGQETTAMTFITQLVHHGMIYVPIGYSDPTLFDMSAPHGGSPYGAGTIAGPKGDRQPSDLEKGVAKSQGSLFAKTCTALVKGRK